MAKHIERRVGDEVPNMALSSSQREERNSPFVE